MLGMIIILLSLALAKPAHAYLDPGTGSYLIQILIGFAAGGAYLVKLFWRQITGFFKKIFSKKKSKHGRKKSA